MGETIATVLRSAIESRYFRIQAFAITSGAASKLDFEVSEGLKLFEVPIFDHSCMTMGARAALMPPQWCDSSSLVRESGHSIEPANYVR